MLHSISRRSGSRWCFPDARCRSAGARLSAPSSAFAAGIALRGEPEAIVDASRYFVQAKHLSLHGVRAFLSDWGEAVPAWNDLPLPALLYGTAFRVLGEHRWAAQFFAAVLLALTALATARVGALLWGEDTGARAALLLLAAPCVLVNAPLLMADVPAMAAVATAAWALLALIERRVSSVLPETVFTIIPSTFTNAVPSLIK